MKNRTVYNTIYSWTHVNNSSSVKNSGEWNSEASVYYESFYSEHNNIIRILWTFQTIEEKCIELSSVSEETPLTVGPRSLALFQNDRDNMSAEFTKRILVNDSDVNPRDSW